MKAILLGFLFLLPALQSVADETTKTSLGEMLAMVQKDGNLTMEPHPLTRDWVGDIRDEKGEIRPLRLEKGCIRNGQIELRRTDPNGRYTGRDAPDFVKNIPSDKVLRSCTSIAELKAHLHHEGMPGFSAWEDPRVAGRFHTVHSWVCFSQTDENKLTYLGLFARASSTEADRKKGIRNIRSIEISRGELRPATPGNRKEEERYKTGAEMFAAMEAEKAQKRKRFPRPLRELIAVDEHPDDSNFIHKSAAVQAIRNEPDPLLFAQLVREIDEGTLVVRSLLESILLNTPRFLDLKPWEKKQEATAIHACIDALPLATENGRVDLIIILLKYFGGGTIEIEEKRGGERIEVHPGLPGSSGSYSLSGAKRPLSVEKVQAELRRRYVSIRDAR